MWFCYVYNMERWKDIIGYEGLYQVSNLGRVKTFNYLHHEGYVQILKSGNVTGGYLRVVLYKNGKRKHYMVHRLVAEAFLPNPLNLPYINHKIEGLEGKRMNMVIFNEDGTIDYNQTTLEWCDAKYNINYGTRNKRVSGAMTNGKLSKKVLQYTLNGEFVREWPSANECGRNGFDQANVSACCRGVKPHYKGYIWKYKGEA